MPASCPKCGASATGKFCQECGSPLSKAVPFQVGGVQPKGCVVQDKATGTRHVDRIEVEGVLHAAHDVDRNELNLLEAQLGDVVHAIMVERLASGAWTAAAIESGAVASELAHAVSAKYSTLGSEMYLPGTSVDVQSVRVSLSAPPAGAGAIPPGTNVLVQWSDGNRYAGVLQQSGQGQSLVAFPNGTTQWIPAHLVTRAS